MKHFCLETYCDSDAEATLRLFRNTVHRINSRDYTAEQIAAWAPADIPLLQWRKRFEKQIAIVARRGDSLLGFADLTRDGYLDRLFVSAEHQRQGIAQAMLERLIAEATSRGLVERRTESSITAKPFFLAMGFDEVARQQVQCRGEWLVNFRMTKPLDAG